MPKKLDEPLLADALQALNQWRGDPSRITRSVELPDEENEELVREVMVSANSMNHHPEIARSGRTTTFTLWTHSLGGVTDLDIALASRIEDLIRRMTGAAPASADNSILATALDPEAARANGSPEPGGESPEGRQGG